jgi:hypothetical protein
MASDAPQTFFSYSREDSEFALRLAKDLRASGASVWLDQLDISAGQRWDRAVEHALNNSPRLLVILSPSSVGSNNVMDEVSFALEEQKVVIPVVLHSCKIPFRLRRVQYIDFTAGYENVLVELLKTIRVVNPKDRSHSHPPVAAVPSSGRQKEIPPATAEQEGLTREVILPEQNQERLPEGAAAVSAPTSVSDFGARNATEPLEDPSERSAAWRFTASDSRSLFSTKRVLAGLSVAGVVVALLLWSVRSPSPRSSSQATQPNIAEVPSLPKRDRLNGPEELPPTSAQQPQAAAPTSVTTAGPKATPNAVPERLQSRLVNAAEVLPTFQAAYGDLHSTTIAPGTFRMVRHESTVRQFLKGELIVSASPWGYKYYWAETVAGSGTAGYFGLLRYENAKWNLYRLTTEGEEFTVSGEDIRIEGDTIAKYTKGSNFEEFVVWQRIIGEHVTDKYLARELSRVETIYGPILAKRASK